MCRSVTPKSDRPARPFRALAARIAVLAAALLMALGVASPGIARPHAADHGTAVVICSDGVAKTVYLDDDGNPVEPSGDEDCAGFCACCPPLASFAALPPAAAAERSARHAIRLVFPTADRVRPFDRRHRPVPRGPPPEETA